jgi:hypothetical protein
LQERLIVPCKHLLQKGKLEMANQEAKHELLRIHIDRQPYDSPNPTTGAALYALAVIPCEKQLFREFQGDQEDLPVPCDGEQITLKKGEHFYTQRVFEIIVNAELKDVLKRELTFMGAVALAFPNPDGSSFDYTVTYKKALGPKPEGSLVDGGTIRIKNGTIINVSRTNKS